MTIDRHIYKSIVTTTTGNHIVNGTEYYVEVTIDFEVGNDSVKIEYFTDADGVSVDSATDNDAAITDFGTPTSLVIGDLGGGGPNYVLDNLIITDDLTQDIKAIRASVAYTASDVTAPTWSSVAFDSDCDGTADGGDGETYTVADGSVCLLCTASEAVTAYIDPGDAYIDFVDGSEIRFNFYTGIGDTKFLFQRLLTAGDRTVLLKTHATEGVQIVVGLEIYDLAANAMVDYDTNIVDVDLGTSVISCPSTVANPIEISATQKISSLIQLNTDVYQYLESVTDNVDITVDGVTISGIGRTQVNTGTLTFTGDNNHVRCVNFSGAVTDNGAGNTYHPICQRGPSRMGMNPN